ncbi:hypothetical protein ACFL35_05445 [Candidatus Riflebacteria bacterium]
MEKINKKADLWKYLAKEHDYHIGKADRAYFSQDYFEISVDEHENKARNFCLKSFYSFGADNSDKITEEISNEMPVKHFTLPISESELDNIINTSLEELNTELSEALREHGEDPQDFNLG